MSLRVEFPSAIEQTLRHQADEAGMDLACFIRELVTESLTHDSDEKRPPDHGISSEDFESRLASLIRIHPQSGRVDDRRESIYAGRGE